MAAIAIQRPHFDSFNLQLGYRYGEDVDPDDIDISRYVPRFEVGFFLPLVELQDRPWLMGMLPCHGFALITGPQGEAWHCDAVTVLSEARDFSPVEPFYSRAGLEPDGALLIRPDGHIAARWETAPSHPAAEVEERLMHLLAIKPVKEVA